MRCDNVGENPYILNWVTRITAEKVWQVNNRGLKVNSCCSTLSSLKSNDGCEGVIPSLPAFRGLTRGKTQMPLLNSVCRTGAETRGKMDQKPSKTLLIKSLLCHSHRMVWVGGDLLAHPAPPSTRPGSSKPCPTWPWTSPDMGDLCQGLITHTGNRQGTPSPPGTLQVKDWNLNNLCNWEHLQKHNLTQWPLWVPFNSAYSVIILVERGFSKSWNSFFFAIILVATTIKYGPNSKFI